MPLSPDRSPAVCTAGAPLAARWLGASVLAVLMSAAVPAASATTTSPAEASGANAASAASVAADVGPTVELNRLEDAGGGCRLTLVVANPGAQRFDELKLDLVLFDGDGIVARRLAVETGPVRANKTVVRLFEAADLPCAGIGRLLLNDVVACTGEDGAIPGCVDRLTTASRAAVPFER
ncbi:Tat pathway signal protein [Pseudoxanthobacter sp. M-2]|uniref:Tat pathway signal protein n=1 Tax=Pseudoxanthobacter sp. M-2 TaxID=3078754 RepID=UPI0038FC8232